MNTLIWNVRARRRRRAEAHLLYAALVSMPFATMLLLVARLTNILHLRAHPLLAILCAVAFVGIVGLIAEAGGTFDPFRLGKTVFEPDLPTSAKFDRLRRLRAFRLHVAVFIVPVMVLTVLIAVG